MLKKIIRAFRKHFPVDFNEGDIVKANVYAIQGDKISCDKISRVVIGTVIAKDPVSLWCKIEYAHEEDICVEFKDIIKVMKKSNSYNKY